MHPGDDDIGKKFGMWLFLYSELLLFGGLFVLFAVYLNRFPQEFVEGGKELNATIGTVNTLILIISSFFVAGSITAIRRNQRRLALWLLGGAIGIAVVFLINKYFEWGYKIGHDIYPGSQTLLEKAPGLNMFYGLYYVITGLHGLHVIVGAILLCVCSGMIAKRRVDSDRYVLLENSGLYWHLVDLIWIFVFPLFYLIL